VRARAADAGFTLLEMLFVVLVSGIVLTFAANFYVDLSAASSAALASSVELRRATSVLDRVARDLEGATLVKKPESLDPLEHPWLFLAEGRGSDGADRLRFQARNHRPRPGAGHESDLVDMAYWLAPSETPGSLDLLRWTSAQPPQVPLDRNFPRRDDPGVELLASGIALFAVRLQDADGAWQSAWDCGPRPSRAPCRSPPSCASRSCRTSRATRRPSPKPCRRCSSGRSCSPSTRSTSRSCSGAKPRETGKRRTRISPA
jgi:prepilin-type N-terminal cleavage/methylation domain-containing protein